jgi:anaerobic ribonucleoside-triphosphate reductase
VLPPHDRALKLYSRVVKESTEKKHRLSLRSKTNQPLDIVKKILKSKVTLTEIKVGINSIRQLRGGREVTETRTKKEIEKLEDEIRKKLDVNIQKLRNPRLVLFNIPEDITLQNVEEILTCQNPEQNIKVGDIKANAIAPVHLLF